jgi:hypothetical protein
MVWDIEHVIWREFVTVTFDAIVLVGLIFYGLFILVQALRVLALLFGVVLWMSERIRGWRPLHAGPILRKLGRRGAVFTNIGSKLNRPVVRAATAVPARARALHSEPWQVPLHPRVVSAMRLSELKQHFASAMH